MPIPLSPKVSLSCMLFVIWDIVLIFVARVSINDNDNNYNDNNNDKSFFMEFMSVPATYIYISICLKSSVKQIISSVQCLLLFVV